MFTSIKKEIIIKEAGKNGKIFTVNFIKKDGSERVMTCRLGVKKHLKGGVSTTTHIPEYVTVYDVVAKGYRTINLETVSRIAGAGQEITFKGREKESV